MTNIEKFYGIDLKIQEEANPFLITFLKEKIYEISSLAKFDVDKFFVYVHYFEVFEVKFWGSHFPLEERIKLIDVRFEVNKKQIDRKQIKFFNELVELKPDEGTVIVENRPYYIQITYDAKKIINKQLKTHLITFIDKDLLRERHKKITVKIYPQGCTDFENEVSKNREIGEDFINTEKILFYERQTKLPIIKLSRKKRQETRKEVKSLIDKILSKPKTIIMQENNNLQNSESKKEVKVETGGGPAFTGDNMDVHHNTFNTQNNKGLEGIDIIRLATDLAKLKYELINIKEEGNFKHIDTIAEIEKAEILAKSEGNGTKVLNHLKKAGKWAFDTATKIGVSVAAEAIKRGMTP